MAVIDALRNALNFGARQRPASIDALSAATYRRLSLAGQFLFAGLAVLLAGMLLIGIWVSRQIERGVISRTASITALYVDSVIAERLQSLATQSRLSDAEVASLDRLLVDTPLGERVVAFKVWSPEGEVIYSPNRSLIGRRFAVKGELARALDGEVAAHMSDLEDPENEFERERFGRLLEVYVPVREHGSGRIIGATEFYQLPDELVSEAAAARRRSWIVVAGVGLVMYLLLAGIVKRGSDTIAAQQSVLQQQVTELSALLEQNARLHERVQQAAGRTTALNEQALRRISADLHDGPGQALALALLRLDALRESSVGGDGAAGDFAVVHGAVRDALNEIRTISAGLRLPELASLSVTEVAQRAVQDHERRSGTPVATHLEDLPDQAPLAVKIALFRSLQEGLSNAVRHGGGVGVAARVWAEAGMLCLAVSDCGAGFTPVEVSMAGQLGLAGMRERAELLSGSFGVESAPGRGTTLRICWPLSEAKTEWTTQSA